MFLGKAANRWLVEHHQCVRYEVVMCHHLLDPKNDFLLSEGGKSGSSRFVVVDSKVFDIYGPQIEAYFAFHRVFAKIVSIKTGEENKTLSQYVFLIEELNSFPINRRSEPIIAIGGGVLTDLVGFVAGTYRRGVPHIKVPTTLMGYIDASIGVKAGINFGRYKNRLGSFTPPAKVFLDKAFFSTLPKKEIRNGIDEILKLAIILDEELFTLLEKKGLPCINSSFQDTASEEILARAVGCLLTELQPNLFEEQLERALDFGHTFSYALEICETSSLLHGEAVLICILLSSFLSFSRNLLSRQDLDRILNLVRHLDLLVDCDTVAPGLLWNLLKDRVHHRDGLQRIPLPTAIGRHTFVNDVSIQELGVACELLKNWKKV